MTTTPTSGAADLPEARLFTKKPVTISATQWFKNGDHPQVRAIAPSDDLFFTGMGGAMLTDREKYGVIGTLESPNHLVTPGDWIITGVAGEHYPCKPDIFEATYSPAALAAGQATAAPAQPAAQQGAAYAALPDEVVRLAQVAIRECQYKGNDMPQDWMESAMRACRLIAASHGQAPAQPDPAYSEACNLATALFKKHFAHLPDFASGQAVWSLCDSTAGVISQIDNMVSGLVQPPTTSPQAADSVTAPAPPPECETEAEKRAFAFGWFKALESERMKAESVQEDAARLDFLIDQGAYVVSDPDTCTGHWLHWAMPDGSTLVQCDEHPTPRAAIDAAIKQGEKQ